MQSDVPDGGNPAHERPLEQSPPVADAPTPKSAPTPDVAPGAGPDGDEARGGADGEKPAPGDESAGADNLVTPPEDEAAGFGGASVNGNVGLFSPGAAIKSINQFFGGTEPARRPGALESYSAGEIAVGLEDLGGNGVTEAILKERLYIVAGRDWRSRGAAVDALFRDLAAKGYDGRVYLPPDRGPEAGNNSLRALEALIFSDLKLPTAVRVDVTNLADAVAYRHGGGYRQSLVAKFRKSVRAGGAEGHCIIFVYTGDAWQELHRGRSSDDAPLNVWEVQWLRPRLRILLGDQAPVEELAAKIEAQRVAGRWPRNDERFHAAVDSVLVKAESNPHPHHWLEQELKRRDQSYDGEMDTASHDLQLAADPLALAAMFTAAFLPSIPLRVFGRVVERLLEDLSEALRVSDRTEVRRPVAADTADGMADAKPSGKRGGDAFAGLPQAWRRDSGSIMARARLTAAQVSDAALTVTFEDGVDAAERRRFLVREQPFMAERCLRSILDARLLHEVEPSSSVARATVAMMLSARSLDLVWEHDLGRCIAGWLRRIVPRGAAADKFTDASEATQSEFGVQGARAARNAGAAIDALAAGIQEAADGELERYTRLVDLTFEELFNPSQSTGRMQQMLRARGHEVVRYVSYGLGLRLGFTGRLNLDVWLRRLCAEAGPEHRRWLQLRLARDMIAHPDQAFAILALLTDWLPEPTRPTTTSTPSGEVAMNAFLQALWHQPDLPDEHTEVEGLAWHPLFGSLDVGRKAHSAELDMLVSWFLHPALGQSAFEIYRSAAAEAGRIDRFITSCDDAQALCLMQVGLLLLGARRAGPDDRGASLWKAVLDAVKRRRAAGSGLTELRQAVASMIDTLRRSIGFAEHMLARAPHKVEDVPRLQSERRQAIVMVRCGQSLLRALPSR